MTFLPSFPTRVDSNYRRWKKLGIDVDKFLKSHIRGESAYEMARSLGLTIAKYKRKSAEYKRRLRRK